MAERARFKPELWPAPVQTGPSKDTEAEAKLVKEVVSVPVETEDSLHQVQTILADHSYHIMDSKVSSQL